MIEKLKARHILVLLATAGGFFIVLMYMGAVGAVATVTMDFYNVNTADFGWVSVLQFSGSIVAAIFLSMFGERLNKLTCFALSLIIVAVAGFLIALKAPFIVVLMFFAIGGFGIGGTDVLGNSLIPDLFPKHTKTTIPILHMFSGVGSICAPFFAMLFVSDLDPQTFVVPYIILSLVSLGLAVFHLISSKRIIKETPYYMIKERNKNVKHNPVEIFKTKEAWFVFICVLLFSMYYMGVMTWYPTFLNKGREIPFETASNIQTFFYIGLLAMRIATPFILKKMSVRSTFILFTIASVACIVAASLVTSVTAIMVLSCIAGFLQGSQTVVMLIVANEKFPTRTASASSAVLLGIYISGIVAPMLSGQLAVNVGYYIPFYLLCVCALASMIFLVLLTRKKKEA